MEHIVLPLHLNLTFKSRLTVVSHAAKQSTQDMRTTLCYKHERSILIERLLNDLL